MKNFLFILIMPMVTLNCASEKPACQPGETSEIKWAVDGQIPPSEGKKIQPGLAGPVVGVIGDRLLVAGGANFPDGMPWQGAKKIYQSDIYLFRKTNRQDMGAIVSKQKLPEPIAYGASVTTKKGIVYLGGENQNGISDKVVLISSQPNSNEIQFSSLPSLPLPLTNLAAACYDHLIYVVGGTSAEGNSDKFFLLDLSHPNAGWQPLPNLPVKIAYAVMIHQGDGKGNYIYVIGGRRKNSTGISDIFNSVYRFDSKENRWEQKQALAYPVSAGTGVAVGPNHILLFGGDRGETFSREEKITVAIKNEKDEQKNKKLVSQKIALLQSHPGFTSEVWLYNTMTDSWKKINPMPLGSPVTTTALLWHDDLVIPSGEIRAGVRTPRLLIGKIINGR